MKKIYTGVLILLLSLAAWGQEEPTLQNLKQHIAFLASDSLEGRRPGTDGELKAMEYIARQFSAYGLKPRGTNGFFQAFEINDGKEAGPLTMLEINGKALNNHQDFFVFPFSADAENQATPTMVSLDSIADIAANNPHFDMDKAIFQIADQWHKDGANAIFFTVSDEKKTPVFNKKYKGSRLPVPVIFLTKKYFDLLDNNNHPLPLRLQTSVVDKKRTAHNVIGFIDNQAPTTVVLGAHYDHLGYGEDGNSMWRGEGRQIHNGADDNASGTAVLIELARKLKSSDAKNNNYLFLAFSAEELGLLGSKYFVDHPTLSLSSINYMINMDMVGRLSDSTKTFSVGGFGTSPAWAGVVKNPKGFNIKTDSSGVGPSDHTSFYRKNIPVLFYFTGVHQDYHKPSDDYDKINYKGAAMISESIYQLICDLNEKPKLSFAKTRETQIVTTAFKVTLGIMPDYAYSGAGIRADGVSQGRPADAAGLKAGDIIIGLDHIKITDMNDYMKALGRFTKGQTITVTFKRSNEEKQARLTF